MRALWIVRDNLERNSGGDTVQILRTAEALRQLNVEVRMTAQRRPDFAGWDVVHLFHLDRLWENEPHCRRLRDQRRPAVLSTIYWPADEYDRGGRTGLQGTLARTFGSETYRSMRLAQRWLIDLPAAVRGRGLSRPTWSFRRSARTCLDAVRVLLPNSRAEIEVIEHALGSVPPAVIVPNAVGSEFLHGVEEPTPREGVLCVGRIEPRKNQLNLILAAKSLDIGLTLIGQAGRFSTDYARQCRDEAGPRVRFIGQSDAAQLQQWYRRSLVHVCPSWYETPGLVNLEAAVNGCAIVATPGGCTREYLGEDAYYCEPNDVDSIRSAIKASLSGGPRGDLGRRVTREFTWEAAAHKTLEGYQLAASQD